jgi:hypothetical protein
MFHLETAIRTWRQRLRASGFSSSETIDELESHLREEFESQLCRGLNPEAAFQLAAELIGDPRSLNGEFSKLACSKYRGVTKFFRPSCFLAALFLFAGGIPAVWNSELLIANRALCFITILAATCYLAALPFLYRSLPNPEGRRVAIVLKSMSAFFACWPVFALLDGLRILPLHLTNSLSLLGWDGYVMCVFTMFAYFVRGIEGPDASTPGSYKFSETAETALNRARDEATKLHHDYVGTEHILLGVLAAESSLLADIFRKASITAEAARSQVEKIAKPAAASQAEARIEYTPRARRALQLAERESRAMNQPCLGVEHIFLGVLLENEGLAGLVLRNLGIDYGTARAEIWKGFGPGSDDGFAPATAG